MTLIFLAIKVIVNTGNSHGLRRTTSSKSSYKIQLDRIENSNKRLSPANEMHFSIRQLVVSHGHDSYGSNESTTRRRVSWHTACISPFDNGSYSMGTIRTNRTNRRLGQASLSIQRVGHILSPANEMHFSIRQRVGSHGHDSYESNESTTRGRVSWHTSC